MTTTQKRKRVDDEPSSFASLFPEIVGGAPAKRANTNTKLTIENTVVPTSVATDWKPVKFPVAGNVDHGVCFGCEYGFASPSDDQPTMVAFFKIFQDNFGRMSNIELARLMHDYWTEEIQKPMREQGHDVADWSPQQIVVHITQHMLEPCVHTSTSIQELKAISAMLRDQVQSENKITGEKRVTLKVLRSLLQVEQELRALYSSKCSRMLFYSDRLKLDDKRAHTY